MTLDRHKDRHHDRSSTADDRPVARRRRLAAGAVALGLVTGLCAGTSGADELGDKRAEAARVAARLQDLTEQQIQLAEDYNQANLQLESADRDIDAAQHRVDVATADVEANREAVRQVAVRAYLAGNDSPTMNVLLTSSADQAPQKKGYLDAASADRQDAIDRLAATRQHLEAEIEALGKAKGEAQDAKDKAERAKQRGDDAIAEQQALQAKVQGELSGLVQQEQARLAEQRRQQNEADLRARGGGDLLTADAGGTTTTTAGGPTTTTSGTGADSGRSTTTSGAPATTAGGPAPTAAAPRPAPTPAPPAPAPAPAPPAPASGAAARAASIALSQLGVPYVWGGASPRGFDCSGLVMWAYAQVGISLPHATSAMYAATRPISMSELQVGDLIFFYGLGHVGIYIGGGRVVHAPHTGDVVRIEQVANMPVTGARRVG